MPQIVVRDLTKSFKVSRREGGLLSSVKSVIRRRHDVIHALNGISFDIGEGELVGYIGPNGAGKSTTVKVMSGIMVPDSGTCEVLDRTPWKHRIEHVRNIGVVFGQRTQLWWDVPVIDSFDLLRDVYRIRQGDYLRTRDELVAVLSLEPLLGVPVRQLSLGQKMRCELAASLLHRPRILFLDEPTIGLDAVSKIAVRSFVKKLNAEGLVTVILTTHDMDDIEALCSRIMVIGRGRILFDGDIGRLREFQVAGRVAKVEFSDTPRIGDCPGVELTASANHHAEFRFDPSRTPAMELIQFLARDNDIRDFVIENPPIEEIVASMYEGFRV